MIQRSIKTIEKVLGANYLIIIGNDPINLYHACQPQLGFIACNDDHEKGMASSIKLGIKALPETTQAVMILLADQPLITESHLLEIIKSWEENPKKITCTSAGKNHGPPAIFPKRYFSKLLKIKGDNGAKDLLSSHDKNLIRIINKHAFIDIDTINDLKNIT